jgi:cathepsin L
MARIFAATIATAAAGGTVNLSFEDCGDASTVGTIKDLQPTSLELGGTTTLVGSGSLTQDVPAGDFSFTAKALGVTILSDGGDLCADKAIQLPLGVGSFNYKSAGCPVKAGDVALTFEATLSAAIPSQIAKLDINVAATGSDGTKALCAVIHTSPGMMEGERDLSAYSFDEYVSEFGKAENGADRKAIFEANMALIKQHNSDTEKSWFATVNQFTDMTNDEFRAMTRGRKEIMFGGEEQPHKLTGRAIPDRKDWREEQGVTAVKDQGGCGSCWAFSAAETFESHLAIQTQTPIQKLSPQQIVSCSPNPEHCGGTGGCQGSTQPLAFNYTVTAGLTTEASYPYRGQTGTCQQSKIKPVAKNGGYKQLTTNSYTELVDAVANVGPVAISIAASGFAFQFYGGGVLSNCNDYVMDHAVQLVGYGTQGTKDYWLVRNSWGSWGEQGYIRMQRYGEGNEPCGTDRNPQDGDACEGDTTPRKYCGECGILSASSYPTDFTTFETVSV